MAHASVLLFLRAVCLALAVAATGIAIITTELIKKLSVRIPDGKIKSNVNTFWVLAALGWAGFYFFVHFDHG